MAKLLGLDVITDYPALTELLESPVVAAGGERSSKLIESLLPGLTAAVLQSVRLLEIHRLRPTTVVYFNYRIQVWALGGFDADPTPPVRVIPAGELMDPAGPVSFQQ